MSVTVRPHVTDEEYRQTEFVVQQFASGVGKDLHQKLVDRFENSRNWVRTNTHQATCYTRELYTVSAARIVNIVVYDNSNQAVSSMQ